PRAGPAGRRRLPGAGVALLGRSAYRWSAGGLGVPQRPRRATDAFPTSELRFAAAASDLVLDDQGSHAAPGTDHYLLVDSLVRHAESAAPRQLGVVQAEE